MQCGSIRKVYITGQWIGTLTTTNASLGGKISERTHSNPPNWILGRFPGIVELLPPFPDLDGVPGTKVCIWLKVVSHRRKIAAKKEVSFLQTCCFSWSCWCRTFWNRIFFNYFPLDQDKVSIMISVNFSLLPQHLNPMERKVCSLQWPTLKNQWETKTKLS